MRCALNSKMPSTGRGSKEPGVTMGAQRQTPTEGSSLCFILRCSTLHIELCSSRCRSALTSYLQIGYVLTRSLLEQERRVCLWQHKLEIFFIFRSAQTNYFLRAFCLGLGVTNCLQRPLGNSLIKHWKLMQNVENQSPSFTDPLTPNCSQPQP